MRILDFVIRAIKSKGDDTNCPMCGHHPYEYVDVGVGMVPVAVNCCNYGYYLFQEYWSIKKVLFLALFPRLFDIVYGDKND